MTIVARKKGQTGEEEEKKWRIELGREKLQCPTDNFGTRDGKSNENINTIPFLERLFDPAPLT